MATTAPIPMMIPAKPMMIPARANPAPCWVPPDRLICERAMNPKTMARTDPIPESQKKNEHTNEATASPFVVLTGGYP